MRQMNKRLIRIEMDTGKEQSNRRRNQELKGETMTAKKEEATDRKNNTDERKQNES